MTATHRDQLQNALDRLQNSVHVILSVEGFTRATGLLTAYGVPRIKYPEELYAVYNSDANANQSLLQIMRDELVRIGVPSD